MVKQRHRSFRKGPQLALDFTGGIVLPFRTISPGVAADALAHDPRRALELQHSPHIHQRIHVIGLADVPRQTVEDKPIPLPHPTAATEALQDVPGNGKVLVFEQRVGMEYTLEESHLADGQTVHLPPRRHRLAQVSAKIKMRARPPQ